MKCIFALIYVLIIVKHPRCRIRKNCVDICDRHGRGAIEICLSEKGVLAKNRLGNTALEGTLVTRESARFDNNNRKPKSQVRLLSSQKKIKIF